MTRKNEIINEIGIEIANSESFNNRDWVKVSIVADLGDGHFAQSGFLYFVDDVEPCTVKSSNRRKFSGLCKELQNEINQECGHKFKQLLIQMEKETGRIKIDFEFDDATRWSIVPSKLKEMREALRPQFD